MSRHGRAHKTAGAAPRDELLRLYAEADALVAGARCVCADAVDALGARCCHFANIGREPYVTEIELALVTRAVAARGGSSARPARAKRRLALAGSGGESLDLRTCPLLSSEGRCTVYASRPLGCRTFFCEGHGPVDRAAARKGLLEISRGIAALSDRVFPRSGGPRPLRRALAEPPLR
jgi:uncharacterized protein